MSKIVLDVEYPHALAKKLVVVGCVVSGIVAMLGGAARSPSHAAESVTAASRFTRSSEDTSYPTQTITAWIVWEVDPACISANTDVKGTVDHTRRSFIADPGGIGRKRQNSLELRTG